MSQNGDIPLPAGFARNTGQAVWEERIMGADIFEIAQKLDISVQQVSELLVEHHRQRQAQPVEAKSFYRDLAVSRIDATAQSLFAAQPDGLNHHPKN